jgi:hypothetical protein
MAFTRFVKATLIFVAAALYLRDDKDMRAAIAGLAIIDENYWTNPLTESLYWLLLAENGWLGWGFFLLFEGMTLWCGFQAVRHGGKSLLGYTAFGILVALLICYPHGMVERILTQTKNLAHWLMLAGMLAGMEMNRRASGGAARR